MKKYIGIPVLLVLMSSFSCQPYEFESSADPCKRYVTIPIIRGGEISEDLYPAYVLPMFIPGQDAEIIFVHRTRRRDKIQQLNLETGKEKTLYTAEADEEISSLDVDSAGNILFVFDRKLSLLRPSGVVRRLLPDESVSKAKWYGARIYCRPFVPSPPFFNRLYQIDTLDHVLQSFVFDESVHDWAIYDTLMLLSMDTRLRFVSLPQLTYVDEIDISDYFRGNFGRSFGNQTSVCVNYKQRLVYFSTRQDIFRVDMSRREPKIDAIWYPWECRVPDANLSLSDDQQYLLSGTYQFAKGIDKSYGILHIETTGRDERILEPR